MVTKRRAKVSRPQGMAVHDQRYWPVDERHRVISRNDPMAGVMAATALQRGLRARGWDRFVRWGLVIVLLVGVVAAVKEFVA